MNSIILKNMTHKRSISSKRLIRYAAAVGTLSGTSSSSCWAFVTPSSTVPSLAQLQTRPPIIYSTQESSMSTLAALSSTANNPFPPQHWRKNYSRRSSPSRGQNTRLFFGNSNRNYNKNDDDNNDDWSNLKRSAGNLLQKAGNKIKSLLPFANSVPSPEGKRAQLLKKQREDDITDGLSTMLKDLPLPFRMAGRMMAPLLSNMAKEMAEQTRQVDDLLEEAQRRIANDSSLVQQLGEPLQVSKPFSQSSSTMVVNGKSSTKIQANFQVVGPYGSGVATMVGSERGIGSLSVNVNGRNLSVGLGGSVYGRSSDGKKVDNIIEAEIIEKK
mmetsp:Transcript_15804/g.33191  ORF Transcript_15804/g.33191 Transcript_15804/m.33191 type:complete len:328 (+) Transcript_15804:156-1139(+)